MWASAITFRLLGIFWLLRFLYVPPLTLEATALDSFKMQNSILVTLALLAPSALAGIQVPPLIIKMSPWEAKVDFAVGERCIKHELNPSYLNAYFDSFESPNLAIDFGHHFHRWNKYLQKFKAQFGTPVLGGRKAPMTGVQTIPGMDLSIALDSRTSTSPYTVFSAEMDAGVESGCKDRYS